MIRLCFAGFRTSLLYFDKSDVGELVEEFSREPFTCEFGEFGSFAESLILRTKVATS